jgi:hypothetical protein
MFDAHNDIFIRLNGNFKAGRVIGLRRVGYPYREIAFGAGNE